MVTHYPIVFEREDSGVVSAYVAGLPVYAQGATRSSVVECSHGGTYQRRSPSVSSIDVPHGSVSLASPTPSAPT